MRLRQSPQLLHLRLPRSVPPPLRASSDTRPWAATRPLTEVDGNASDQTALLRAALALFENCNLPPGVLDENRKCVPPHRPPSRRQPKVSREQVILNSTKKEEKEEQELHERKTALDIPRKNAEDKKLRVMEQATVVSDLKNRLVELREDIANNPTPDVSEDEDVAAAPMAAPPAPPPTFTPAVPLENTPLDCRSGANV